MRPKAGVQEAALSLTKGPTQRNPPPASLYGPQSYLADKLCRLQLEYRAMCLRSGTDFTPYALNPSKRTFCLWTAPDSPIATMVSAEPLVQCAVAREDLRFEQGGGRLRGLWSNITPPNIFNRYRIHGRGRRATP
jgi:hypothetical protein